jgi:flagellin-like protein
MNRKMKMLRSRKALSPVVASIILIAVTVAVSIAVAAWMGALTFTFTKTEELKITGYTWVGNNQVNLTCQNSGASDLTIGNAQVDDAAATWSSGVTLLTKGATTWVLITKPSGNFATGVKYNFAVLTSSGNKYLYQATKP